MQQFSRCCADCLSDFLLALPLSFSLFSLFHRISPNTISQLSLIDAEEQEKDAFIASWHYCKVGLSVLFCFHHTLKSELAEAGGKSEFAGLISLGDQQNIRTLLEFLIGFAILPCLQPGVGFALAERVGRQARMSEVVKLGRNPNCNLLLVLRILVRACMTVQSLRDLVLEKGLLDVCSAALQAAFEPREEFSTANSNEALHHILLESSSRLQPLAAVLEARALWNEIITYAPAQPIMEALLMLSGRRGQNTPPWLKTICYYQLTQRLIVRGNVLAFYAVLLRAALVQEQVDVSKLNTVALWQQCERAAIMLASCPCPAALSQESYLTAIAPQG